MSRLFSLAMEELNSEEIIDDEILDVNANPDTAIELTDIETATEEFNRCRDELYGYVVAMEEATDTVDRLVKQIARNNELISLAKEQDVSDVDMAIATETIHTIANDINYNGLDGIRLSQEGFKSNIERLQVANEASEGMIASIIKAIKDFFIKIINMVKKLYIKFMSWLNIYDKKLIGLKKDFHNVLYKGKVLIDTELLLKVFELFPFIKSSSYEVSDLKLLFQDRLQIAKWVEHLNPKNIDKTIEEIVDGTFISKQKTIPYIDAVYERLDKILNKSGRDEYPAIITSFKNGNVTYVSASKGLDHKYTLNDIKTEVIDIPSNMKVLKNGDGTVSVDDGINKFTLKDTSISSRDFSDMADYTSKNLTSNLKEFNDNILKLQNKCKDILDKMSGSNVDEIVKNNLKTIQYLGGRVSVDMCLSIMDSIKNYIKAMVTIHSECITILPNYRLLIDCYKSQGLNAEIRYLDKTVYGNKYPYLWSRDVFDEKARALGYNSSKDYTVGGYCIRVPKSGGKYVCVAKTIERAVNQYIDQCGRLGVDKESLHMILHLNTDREIIDIPFTYFHEMGHAVLDQNENIDPIYYQMYVDPKAANASDMFMGTTSEFQVVKYTENPIEVQADAYACLMTGRTWRDVWFGKWKLKGFELWRYGGYKDWCEDIGIKGEELKNRENRYRKLFEKETATVKQWANIGCVARLKLAAKSFIRKYDEIKTDEIDFNDCYATIQGISKENGRRHVTCKNGKLVTGDEQKEVVDFILMTAFKGIHKEDEKMWDGLGVYYGRVNKGLMGCMLTHPEKDDIGRERDALIVWSDSTPIDKIYKTLDAMGLDKEAFKLMEKHSYRRNKK